MAAPAGSFARRTYDNAYLAIQSGNGETGGFACATVEVEADGEAAQGTGCTLLS
jgi:hypothetical protein